MSLPLGIVTPTLEALFVDRWRKCSRVEQYMTRGNPILYLAGLLGLIPVVIAYLIAPGSPILRAAAALSTLITLLLGVGFAWYLGIPPSEPLAAVLAGSSLFTGWRLAKFLDRKLNEKPAASGTTKSPTAGLRKIP